MGTTFDSFHRNDAFDTRLRVDAFDVYGAPESYFKGTGKQRLCINSRCTGAYATITLGNFIYSGVSFFGLRTASFYTRVYRQYYKYNVESGIAISTALFQPLVQFNYTENPWTTHVYRIGDWGAFNTGDWNFDNSGLIGSGAVTTGSPANGTRQVIPLLASAIPYGDFFFCVVNSHDYVDNTLSVFNEYIQVNHAAGYPLLEFNL